MQITDKYIFERLFREYYSLLCNYAGKFIIDSQVREDIVQNFFISILEKKNLSVTEESFLPYAYRSIKNSCINYYKSESIKEGFLENLSKEWCEEQEEQEESIYKEDILLALQKLPPQSKKIFLLRCITGLKYKEIAEYADISVNTVKYHLGESFRIMREELKHLTFTLFLIFS